MKMESLSLRRIGLLGVAWMVSLTQAGFAYAGVVYDDQVYSAYESQAAQDREILRSVVETGNRAQVTQQAQTDLTVPTASSGIELPVTSVPAPAPVSAPVSMVSPTQAPAPILVPASSATVAAPAPVLMMPAPEVVQEAKVEHLSQSEMIRRERVRQEVKNEDTLQMRLEELRLRDEKSRMDKIIGADEAVAAHGAVTPLQPAQQTVVISPVDVGAPNTAGANSQDRVVQVQASAVPISVIDQVAEEHSGTTFSVAPRLGLSGVTGTNLIVNPRFTTGLGIGVEASEYLSINIGYQFSEYGVSIMSANPYLQWMQNSTAFWGSQNNFETIAMRQNVFELGTKIYLLDRKASFRPFLGGGGAYAKSFINFDQNAFRFYQPFFANNFGPDYELDQFLAYVSGGFDIKVSKSVSLGFTGSFYKVLSARENFPIPTPYFFNPNQWYNQFWFPQFGNNPGAFDKNFVGASLARTNFYSLVGTVSFSF